MSDILKNADMEFINTEEQKGMEVSTLVRSLMKSYPIHYMVTGKYNAQKNKPMRMMCGENTSLILKFS